MLLSTPMTIVEDDLVSEPSQLWI